MFFVKNNGVKAIAYSDGNEHLGGRFFKNYSFFIQYHIFLVKNGMCLNVYIYFHYINNITVYKLLLYSLYMWFFSLQNCGFNFQQ